MTVRFGPFSTPILRENILGVFKGLSPLSTNLTRELAAREGTLHLQTCMPSPGLETQALRHSDSNPGKGTDDCKRIVLCGMGGTVNNRRAACPLARLVEGEKRREALTTRRVFYLNIWVEPIQILLSPAWSSKLLLTTGVQLAPNHDEFRAL
ncbi:hypothetical protein TNCV_2556711 [Trichonephila clavipes]|nr:hypothetical protein TNCV_2556711 [Trichonephila clavipes]